MRRAVAFARDIKTSKQLAQMFPLVVEGYSALLDARENDGDPVDDTNRNLRCEVRHVDGTYNALERNAELMWLKGVVAEDECRILTNARCLSEGVDVPALDVMSREVGQSGDWWAASDGGVGSVVIVEVQPAR